MRALTLGHWAFTPSPLPGLAALLLVVLFVRLGFWQLQRGDEVRAHEAEMRALTRLPPIDLNRPDASRRDDEELRWRSATVRGRWLSQPQLLLDNQPLDGQAGYFVFTLLHLDGCDCAQLVNRGWRKADPDRSILPPVDIPVPATAVLHGNLVPPPLVGVGARSGIERLPGGVLRLQKLDLAAVPLPSGIRLLPLVLQVDATGNGAFQRNSRQAGLRAERHRAYAVQWFAFAVLAAGLYLGLNLKRR